jgi:hypothetical protein
MARKLLDEYNKQLDLQIGLWGDEKDMKLGEDEEGSPLLNISDLFTEESKEDDETSPFHMRHLVYENIADDEENHLLSVRDLFLAEE